MYKKKSSTSSHTSSEIVKKIIEKLDNSKETYSNEEIRDILLNLIYTRFFMHYADRETYEEIPLLTSDNVVIPEAGLKKPLFMNKDIVNKVPTIAGSNRDEVKLWLATAEYFVELDYSAVGSLLNIPNVKLKDEDAFEAFNYYRSSAWKIRGVDVPLGGLYNQAIMIFMHTDTIGMIIEDTLLQTSRSLSGQLMLQKYLF